MFIVIFVELKFVLKMLRLMVKSRGDFSQSVRFNIIILINVQDIVIRMILCVLKCFINYVEQRILFIELIDRLKRILFILVIEIERILWIVGVWVVQDVINRSGKKKNINSVQVWCFNVLCEEFMVIDYVKIRRGKIILVRLCIFVYNCRERK